MFRKPFKKYQQHYNKLYAQLYRLQEQLDEVETGSSRAKQLDVEICNVNEEISGFVENTYALAVFEYYKKKQPELIRVSTGEQMTWDAAFGSSFEAVSRTLRHSLVGLVEGDGRYSLK